MGVNHYTWFDSIAAAVPDRTAIALPDRNLSYREVAERVRRLAHVLLDHGLGQVKKPRSDLKGWESGQDHVGLYLYNGREYLEATLGADGARAVPFNVNYRYVEEELTYLLNDADTAALVYHAAFAPTLAAVLPNLKRRPLLLQVSDASGNNLVEGALDYEEALAGASSDPLHTEPSEEDLYILYTGGTTGMPKGTLWTQAAIYSAALAAFSPNSGFSSDTLEHHIEAAVAAAPNVCLPLPPFMHGAAQWMALGCLIGGNTVAIQSKVDTFDPADVWRTVERHKVTALIMVGDAFGRPLCEELDRQTYDTSSLLLLLTGGAVTSPAVKERLLAHMPHLLVADVAGSSETGGQMSQISSAAGDTSSGVFSASPGTMVVDETMSFVVDPGQEGTGWLAKLGDIPLGYLGDQAKTERTFPVVAGQRMVIPGDRAKLRADGRIELLGRESVTINSGGEKIFAEEVEQALSPHPAVDDVIVVGRPSERWGNEVVALVQLHPGSSPTDDELLTEAATHVASFKLPKSIIRVPSVRRSPAGKPDYGWARDIATQSAD